MEDAQMPLATDVLVEITPPEQVEREDRIQKKFLAFHEKNPIVYDMLCGLARKAKAKGKTKAGIKALYEICRWDLSLRLIGDETFALPNEYTSRYARLIMQQEEDLVGLFELRELRAE